MLMKNAGEAQPPFAAGPLIQFYPTPPTPFPVTLATVTTWSSGVIISDGFKAIAVGLTSSLAGTLTIQRYIDQAGTVPVGAAISAAAVGTDPVWADVNDGVAFGSFTVSFENTGGTTATLSAFSLLQSAA